MSRLERFVEDRSVPAGGAPADAADPRRPEVLRQLLGARAQPAPGEVCELCAAAVADEHRHVVDLADQRLLCVCRGCGLLFDQPGAGRFTAVPERVWRVEPFHLEDDQWAALQIPVGMAFVMESTPLQQVAAFYPSPAGATESELSLEAWSAIVADNPPLGALAPDVEAALIRAGRRGIAAPPGRPQCYIVPVDRCYELVGALRLHWRGFDGGKEVRDHIAAFFDELERGARPAGGAQ